MRTMEFKARVFTNTSEQEESYYDTIEDYYELCIDVQHEDWVTLRLSEEEAHRVFIPTREIMVIVPYIDEVVI